MCYCCCCCWLRLHLLHESLQLCPLLCLLLLLVLEEEGPRLWRQGVCRG